MLKLKSNIVRLVNDERVQMKNNFKGGVSFFYMKIQACFILLQMEKLNHV